MTIAAATAVDDDAAAAVDDDDGGDDRIDGEVKAESSDQNSNLMKDNIEDLRRGRGLEESNTIDKLSRKDDISTTNKNSQSENIGRNSIINVSTSSRREEVVDNVGMMSDTIPISRQEYEELKTYKQKCKRS